MYVNVWGWFNQYEHEAIAKGDTLGQRLVSVAREGWKYRELAEGDKALLSFAEGLRIARQRNEPCWELFHQFWMAVIHFYVRYDYQEALAESIKLLAEIRKERYTACLLKGAIVYLAARVYFTIDFSAYEIEIVALLDYLEAEIGMDEDTYLQMLATRADIDIYRRRYDTAKDKLQQLISLSSNWPFRLYDAYSSLRRIAFIEGDLQTALSYCQLALKQAHIMLIQNCIASEKLWEAVLLKYLGEDTLAREKYYAALAHFQDYQIPLDANYHSASAEYLELDKQHEAALKLGENILAIVKAKPSILQQIDAYCAYIALLGRCGRDFSVPLAEAKRIAEAALKPDDHLKRLAYIEAGNYFEYEWQKNSRKNNAGQS